MAAMPRSDVKPAVLADARRAADKLRKAMAVKGRTAGTRAALKTDTRTVRALLKLVDAMSVEGPRAAPKTIPKEEVTPNQAADILGMSRPSVMRLIDQGELHPRMVHSRHKLMRAEVAALAERQTRERRKALAKLTELSEDHDF